MNARAGNAVRSGAARIARAGFAAALALIATAAAATTDVPYLTGRVVDNAEILSPDARARLTASMAAHEQATGNQIAVLTVGSLGGDSIEGFATRVFESWKLGKKGQDNGVLVVVAPKDRKMRIEVGYGLEGKLPDVTASRIIRNVMTPAFKDSHFDQGVEAGVAAIVGELEGKPVAATAGDGSGGTSSPASAALNSDGAGIPFPMNLLLGVFVFGIIGLFTVIGVMTPGMGWFLYLFLIPFWAMFPFAIFGPKIALGLVSVYLVAYPIAKWIVSRQPWYAKAALDLKRKGSASIGGFTFSSSSGSSGSSSDGGGFSGGGGDSGGGGSSGSW